MDIAYKDLDHIGPYSVQEVEDTLASAYGVPELMKRAQYVHFASRVGLHRVLHRGTEKDLIDRSKFAREVTRHLNYHVVKGDLNIDGIDKEETNGKVWR